MTLSISLAELDLLVTRTVIQIITGLVSIMKKVLSQKAHLLIQPAVSAGRTLHLGGDPVPADDYYYDP